MVSILPQDGQQNVRNTFFPAARFAIISIGLPQSLHCNVDAPSGLCLIGMDIELLTSPCCNQAGSRSFPRLTITLSCLAPVPRRTRNIILRSAFVTVTTRDCMEPTLASVYSTPSRRPPRILVVEDELFIALLIEETVRHLGYRVCGVADNIAKARLEFSKNRFDAVLLDLNINGKCSPELADHLAKLKVPFAFITGFDYLVEPRHALVPILQKPFTSAQLSALLISLVGHQPVQRQSEVFG